MTSEPRSVCCLVGMGSVFAVTVFVAGCGSSGPIPSDQKNLGTPSQPVAKFAGTVTIDGKTPREAIKRGLTIMLYDPKKPPEHGTAPLSAIVNVNGHFEFTTYQHGDGAPEGSYIALFVSLEHARMGRSQGYHQPDALKNLYNDPDKNKDVKDFNVTLQKPGETDHQFNLDLAGKEPPSSPGPNAITSYR
jgi:hypothetical protein